MTDEQILQQIKELAAKLQHFEDTHAIVVVVNRIRLGLR